MSYWDEFVRAPQQNRNRVCIRPEISRTLSWGAIGTSDGMFYDKFIKHIALNDVHVPFTAMDLSYLHKVSDGRDCISDERLSFHILLTATDDLL